ncbi:lytic transglycosylase domain-containing protein [Shewanella sp. SG44-6]|uniref:lytic transglycosylase domain-containing protein n=1 Tax=Shewanella sp. SG44-6 TaxID=2760959 RepID=UPI0016034337|nr:lytic transglycosylase domain-containing protein [Shewanella sp. SG44-6]MBB1390225.1 lytic transglycosylase domain-containing protein [Shewanella sp. SG44-6]
MLDISDHDISRGEPVREAIVTECAENAAYRRNIDPDILLSIILEGERGNNGSVVSNTNGSYDLGVAQVNTIQFTEPWFKKIYPDWKTVANNVCVNISAAADVLKRRIDELSPGESIWNAVGHYNSKTKLIKLTYLRKVMIGYRKRAELRGSGFNVEQIK